MFSSYSLDIDTVCDIVELSEHVDFISKNMGNKLLKQSYNLSDKYELVGDFSSIAQEHFPRFFCNNNMVRSTFVSDKAVKYCAFSADFVSIQGPFSPDIGTHLSFKIRVPSKKHIKISLYEDDRSVDVDVSFLLHYIKSLGVDGVYLGFKNFPYTSRYLYIPSECIIRKSDSSPELSPDDREGSGASASAKGRVLGEPDSGAPLIIPIHLRDVILRTPQGVSNYSLSECPSGGFPPLDFVSSIGQFGGNPGLWIQQTFQDFSFEVFLSDEQVSFLAPMEWCLMLNYAIIDGKYCLSVLSEQEAFELDLHPPCDSITTIEYCHTYDDWKCSPSDTYQTFSRLCGSKLDHDKLLRFPEFVNAYNNTPYVPSSVRHIGCHHSQYKCAVCSSFDTAIPWTMKKRKSHLFRKGIVMISSSYSDPMTSRKHFVLKSSYGVVLVKYQSPIILSYVLKNLISFKLVCACSYGLPCDICGINSYEDNSSQAFSVRRFLPSLHPNYLFVNYSGVTYFYYVHSADVKGTNFSGLNIIASQVDKYFSEAVFALSGVLRYLSLKYMFSDEVLSALVVLILKSSCVLLGDSKPSVKLKTFYKALLGQARVDGRYDEKFVQFFLSLVLVVNTFADGSFSQYSYLLSRLTLLPSKGVG